MTKGVCIAYTLSRPVVGINDISYWGCAKFAHPKLNLASPVPHNGGTDGTRGTHNVSTPFTKKMTAVISRGLKEGVDIATRFIFMSPL